MRFKRGRAQSQMSLLGRLDLVGVYMRKQTCCGGTVHAQGVLVRHHPPQFDCMLFVHILAGVDEFQLLPSSITGVQRTEFLVLPCMNGTQLRPADHPVTRSLPPTLPMQHIFSSLNN